MVVLMLFGDGFGIGCAGPGTDVNTIGDANSKAGEHPAIASGPADQFRCDCDSFIENDYSACCKACLRPGGCNA